MTNEPINRFSQSSASEWIGSYLDELSIDAVGLWQIIPNARAGFGLEGAELVEFVRRCLIAIVGRGAKPVRGGRGTAYQWIVQPQYGNSPDEIADRIVAEWVAAGMPNPDLGGLWFALPDIYLEKAVV